jgi:hypothetical protein
MTTRRESQASNTSRVRPWCPSADVHHDANPLTGIGEPTSPTLEFTQVNRVPEVELELRLPSRVGPLTCERADVRSRCAARGPLVLLTKLHPPAVREEMLVLERLRSGSRADSR